jgi:hypothetical protein
MKCTGERRDEKNNNPGGETLIIIPLIPHKKNLG